MSARANPPLAPKGKGQIDYERVLAEITGELPAAEAGRLAELEAVVQRGMQAFVEAGIALAEIRDQQLYRVEHATFEDYCRERWGFSRSRGYRLIEAAEVAGALSPIGDIPANEAQARELVPLLDAPTDLVEIWRELRAEYGGDVTAAKVRDLVARHHTTTTRAPFIRSPISVEWYTPARYVEAARAVLGGIDLDPASCEIANRTVRATRFYTADDDGLSQPWVGRVWLNPPYAGAAGAFVARLVEAYKAGQVDAAVALVNANCTDTAWFQVLWDYPLCFTDHRIYFATGDDPGRFETRPVCASAFAYLGPDRERFADVFGRFGAVVARWGKRGAA